MCTGTANIIGTGIFTLPKRGSNPDDLLVAIAESHSLKHLASLLRNRVRVPSGIKKSLLPDLLRP